MANVLVNAPKTAKRGSVVEIKALILQSGENVAASEIEEVMFLPAPARSADAA